MSSPITIFVSNNYKNRMISIYNIKPKFQKLLRPLLTMLHKFDVTANQITTASILLSMALGVAFWNADKYPLLFLLLPLGLLMRMALNALDGMMAREYNQQSKKGELLNEIGDVVSDIFIFFPLLKFEKNSIYLIVAFICLSILNELVGVMGKAVGNERRYEGRMGKSDRAFVISVYGLISYFFDSLLQYSYWLFLFVSLLLIISTYTRFTKAIK